MFSDRWGGPDGADPARHSRRDVVERLIAHLREAKRMGCELVVFPELTLTTFFPRWWMTDQAEIDSFFEQEMPSNETAPLFTEAKRAGHGLFAWATPSSPTRTAACGASTPRSWSSATAASSANTARSICRAMPSTSRERQFQHLEKRYFEVGNLGFPVFSAFGGIMGMCICNDRRWPETYRVMGLQNVEMVMLGYNTPLHNPPSPEHDEHTLVPQPALACRPAPTRTAPGWSASPRAAPRRACPRSPTA